MTDLFIVLYWAAWIVGYFMIGGFVAGIMYKVHTLSGSKEDISGAVGMSFVFWPFVIPIFFIWAASWLGEQLVGWVRKGKKK